MKRSTLWHLPLRTPVEAPHARDELLPMERKLEHPWPTLSLRLFHPLCSQSSRWQHPANNSASDFQEVSLRLRRILKPSDVLDFLEYHRRLCPIMVVPCPRLAAVLRHPLAPSFLHRNHHHKVQYHHHAALRCSWVDLQEGPQQHQHLVHHPSVPWMDDTLFNHFIILHSRIHQLLQTLLSQALVLRHPHGLTQQTIVNTIPLLQDYSGPPLSAAYRSTSIGLATAFLLHLTSMIPETSS